MGLFGSLLKNGISDGLSKGISKGISNAFEKAVETAVKPAAENLANKAADNINDAAETLGEASAVNKETKSAFAQAMENLEKAAEKYNAACEKAEKQSGSSYSGARANGLYEHGTAEYFCDIIAENIPGVETKKNVSVTEVTGSGAGAVPVDVLVLKNGIPAAAVILVPKNSYKNRPVTAAMDALKSKGITPLRFMQEFENEPGYVADRIKAVL